MRAFAILLALLPLPAFSHEFWLRPVSYQIDADGMLIADIVNGQGFEGIKLSYLAPRIVHYSVFNGDAAQDIALRNGDTPGLQWPPLGEGLHVVAYQAAVATVDYEDWAKFERFVHHKDLPASLEDHRANGFPEVDFIEAYSRFSKTLIGVGNSAGVDRRTGLETELVALANPYTDDLSTGFPVQLFYREDARADEQIEVFDRAPDGTVSISTLRTDATGTALVPVQAGHEYMLDAVVLRAPSDAIKADTGAIYETLWANLTFAMPAQ